MTLSYTLKQIAAESSGTSDQGLPMPAAGVGAAVFAEPWQAQVFALTLQLHERGLFDWGQWAAALAAQIQRAQAAGDQDDGSNHYRHWTDALEAMLIDKEITTAEQIHALEHAWEHAATRTPHGQPIELSAADAGHLR